ncbi:hypothetical protein SAMN04488102_101324 [Alkalibacterium subtropicum]|uniref:Uncharacterized protein n=1 Tax=Alkalibacterium subtropicum TaxID=753702 RepID=A0A1I1EYA1_9LACT|nr:hypothetical protein [Alkalibacterium subtropicum]SFB89920.1 hypothetical protein SAMN04488102_101324 [Alkalibacterium subtropicum]
MFVIEMTTYESDFVFKNTESTGAYDIRTFDIDHEMSLFAYYYEDYIHLKIRRYNDQETTMNDWKKLKSVGLLYPDIDFDDTKDIFLDEQENQLHIQIAHTIYKRNDKS